MIYLDPVIDVFAPPPATGMVEARVQMDAGVTLG